MNLDLIAVTQEDFEGLKEDRMQIIYAVLHFLQSLGFFGFILVLVGLGVTERVLKSFFGLFRRNPQIEQKPSLQLEARYDEEDDDSEDGEEAYSPSRALTPTDLERKDMANLTRIINVELEDQYDGSPGAILIRPDVPFSSRVVSMTAKKFSRRGWLVDYSSDDRGPLIQVMRKPRRQPDPPAPARRRR